MNLLDKIKSIEYDKNENKIFGIKSGIVWGRLKDKNVVFPLVYISKPKNISQEDFNVILEKIDIQIRR